MSHIVLIVVVAVAAFLACWPASWIQRTLLGLLQVALRVALVAVTAGCVLLHFQPEWAPPELIASLQAVLGRLAELVPAGDGRVTWLELAVLLVGATWPVLLLVDFGKRLVTHGRTLERVLDHLARESGASHAPAGSKDGSPTAGSRPRLLKDRIP
jgi:hypothetical protein